MRVDRRLVLPRMTVVVAALMLCASCVRPSGTPQISFAYPATRSAAEARTFAQQVIDGWAPVRVAEVLVPNPSGGSPSEVSRNVAMADQVIGLRDIAGVVGHLGSRTTLLVAPMYSEARVPLIVPIATSRRIGRVGGWVFQLAPDEDAEGEFLVRFAVERLGARRITVVYLFADEFGTGLRDGVTAALKRRGMAPIDQFGILEDSDHDRKLAESLRLGAPDALILAIRNRSTLAIARSARQRLPGVPLLAGDSVDLNEAFVRELGAAADRLHVAAFWHPDLARPESREFVDRYRAAGLPAPSTSDAMFYDGIMVLASAVRDIGRDPAAVRRYLSELGARRPAYSGVTGIISFQQSRTINLVMTQPRDGRVVLVEDR